MHTYIHTYTYTYIIGDMTAITPFDPTIPREDVDRLFRKLGDTRLPGVPVVPDAGDEYGM